MKFKLRLKAALKALINPNLIWQPVIYTPALEPNQVMDNQLLAGKNALITGAGRNIGKSIALEMAKQGANIYFTDIVQERCINLEQELKEYPVKVKGFISDISNIQDIDNLYAFLITENITIDLLVNNAGIPFGTVGIEKFDLTEWQKMYETNVFGPIYLTKLITAMMIDKKISGSIIFITSIHQFLAGRWASYSSSKVALGKIIEELAIDLASYNIRVNGIAPSLTKEDEAGKPVLNKYALLYRTAIKPCYIGRAAVYLASDYFSKHTTGTILKIDAGVSLYNSRVAETLPQFDHL